MDAILLACAIARKNKGKVYAVHVIEVKRSLPLDAEMPDEATSGESLLTLAERAASDADFRIEGELLQARDAGHAIVDEAMERGVDLILMGDGAQGADGRVPDGPRDAVRREGGAVQRVAVAPPGPGVRA